MPRSLDIFAPYCDTNTYEHGEPNPHERCPCKQVEFCLGIHRQERDMELRSRLESSAAVALVTFLLCSPSSGQDGLQLFHKMQTALGGAEKIAAIHDLEQQVRAETWDGNGRRLGEVRKRTRWVRPDYLRLDQVGPGSTYVLYFDGTSGWEILPDKRVADLVGGELKFAQKYVRDFVLNTLLADRDPRYQITSPAPNVVRISDGDVAHQLDITLDPASWLPVKTTSISLADPAHPIPSETVTTEWETVRGIRFARRWSVFRSGVRLAEATVERTTLNSGIKPSDLAVKPPDLAPVMSRQ